MAKELQLYGDFTAQQLKDRASIPSQDNISFYEYENQNILYGYYLQNQKATSNGVTYTDVNGVSQYESIPGNDTTNICSLTNPVPDDTFNMQIIQNGTCNDIILTGISCTNISIAGVHNVLQSSLLNLYGLCESPRVNKYSGFGPREWVVNGDKQDIISVTKKPYSLGNFAGYNHNALPFELTGVPETINFSYFRTTCDISYSFNSHEFNFSKFPTYNLKFAYKANPSGTWLYGDGSGFVTLSKVFFNDGDTVDVYMVLKDGTYDAVIPGTRRIMNVYKPAETDLHIDTGDMGNPEFDFIGTWYYMSTGDLYVNVTDCSNIQYGDHYHLDLVINVYNQNNELQENIGGTLYNRSDGGTPMLIEQYISYTDAGWYATFNWTIGGYAWN